MDIDTDNLFPRTKIGRDHQMRDMFRHGKVIERKLDEKQGPLVRVQYLDKQGLISKWLPIKQYGSRKTMHCYVPKIGDDVSVNMLPNGAEDGFVDGSFFNTGNPPPPGVDIDTRHFKTEDQTIIEYREKDSTFNLDASMATNAGVVQVTAKLIILTAPTIQINGFIQHSGDMVTTGIHTDANGVHMGGTRSDEIEELKRRVLALENEVENLKQRIR